MRMSKLFRIFIVLFVLTACSKELKKAVVRTQTSEITYFLELADTPSKMAKGLMYRKYLPSNQGMLFIFDETHYQPVAMWMKNTFISLDMLFLSQENTIIAIYENAQPLSLRTISPTKEYVSAVIELNAGEIKKHNIRVGDKVLY